MNKKKDIEGRADIEILLNRFYERLLQDDTISYLFTDIAGIKLQEHIPVLVSFWDMVLFGTAGYSNNTMLIHQQLNRKSPLSEEHFNTWISYFEQTVDELFSGSIAIAAKGKARQLAHVIQQKINR